MGIRYEPAECYLGCEEETCHLMHQDCWYVIAEDTNQEYGPFWLKEEAVKMNKAHMLPDT